MTSTAFFKLLDAGWEWKLSWGTGMGGVVKNWLGVHQAPIRTCCGKASVDPDPASQEDFSIAHVSLVRMGKPLYPAYYLIPRRWPKVPHPSFKQDTENSCSAESSLPPSFSAELRGWEMSSFLFVPSETRVRETIAVSNSKEVFLLLSYLKNYQSTFCLHGEISFSWTFCLNRSIQYMV